jgi:CRP-like cAMP-binding protein
MKVKQSTLSDVKKLSQYNSFFHGFSKETLKNSLGHIITYHYHGNKIIFMENDLCDRVYFIVDGWIKICTRNIKGEEIKLAPLGVQYIDYSIWQRNWLSGEKLDNQLNYWKEKLSGIPDLIDLPTDRVRPKELSYVGGYYNFELESDLSKKIEELCKREGVSLYMFLLSTLDILLHKLSGNEDIVVGSPIANRHFEETERMIGFFVNTIVSRSMVRGEKSFKELL